MSHYFFDIHNSTFSSKDDVGLDCVDRDQVNAHALRLLCMIAKDDPLQHMHSHLGAIVRDMGNHVVATATLSLSATWVSEA